MNNAKFNVWYWILAIFGVLIIQYLFAYSQQVTEIPYSQFQTYLRENKIAEVAVSDNYVQGTFKQALPGGETVFVSTRVDPALVDELQQSGAVYTGRIESNLLGNILSWTLPILLFFGIWYVMIRRMGAGVGGGLMQIGKSRAKIYVETDVKVSFDDVAGVDEAEDELKEIVEFLRNATEYGRLGGRMPKGVLLVGPPGTGKTLIARAVAGEAGVPFFSISGSEFVEMFVGVGAARVRDLFEQARAKAPAIIFIDELDALGRARGAGPMMGGHDEKEQTLNQLLVELDGFDPSLGVVLLAATNRPEILDPALLRAGRFDRQVLVDRPDKGGRIQILKLHMAKAKIGADVDPEQVAALTPGFTGADLANLVNEAALLATRRKAEAVTMNDFTNAVERIVAGLEKRNRLLNPKERQIVAYHEMGHALVALSLPGVDPVHKVSITPRGVGALGYTIQRPTEDRFLMTREELENKMAVLLGGRAAELIVFAHLSTGAADDLAKVTDIARAMVTRYGMSEKIGHIALETEQRSYLAPDPFFSGARQHDYGEHTADAIDEEVRRIIDRAFEPAVDTLTRRRDTLEASATKLLEVETLGADELQPLAVAEPATPSVAPLPSSQ
ncbi:cell division protease FtsH [Pseudorhizobium tarimense]|uniref:ATP-dependent zinc metalloprotease FtsH n=1 Tax=Pseudorhizobium tarimense TaxID=1079109 RepID=A0ABV2H0R2_9HYPH|nr:ATP-dependent zinc metalloprotease FtsH [Pseudorhizobium tarimense]MCJ8517452.1 ATP-dependent zinc metalloprotease FtsH [Pseudorhizobium tarimense]